MEKLELLKAFFGHDAFRPGQEDLADALLGGRDVLGVMPTGAGKSVCYQLPALMLPGMTLVVSPLISLMKDQVSALVQSGIPGGYLNSSLTPGQCAEVLRRAEAGRYKLLYVAPERLLSPGLLRLARRVKIPLLAVDEAHCVSQWGQDFRPSDLLSREFLEKLPARPAVGAFTATATVQVKEDVEKLLGLEAPLRVTTGFDRPNLYFQVSRPKDKEVYLLSLLKQRREQSGIVYCATRKLVESVCALLGEKGFAATRYHAGLSDEERRRNQEDFVYDRARVMVATNAFGMGIDKSNVSFVIHYNMPKNVESYYQEAGRAGRDGSPADCILLFAPGDVRTARYLIENSEDNGALSEADQERVRRLDLIRLDKMTGYCKTSGCLRGYLLRYFGEAAPRPCGACGNCKNANRGRKDITLDAQKILSGVARVENKYRKGLGVTAISGMLLGSRERRILELGLNELSTYGILKGTGRTMLLDEIDFLIEGEYLRRDGEEYPVLRLGPGAKAVLFGGERVLFTPRRQEKEEQAAGSSVPPQLEGRAAELYQRLRAVRSRCAEAERVPVYVIFTNATLADMAMKQPRDIPGLKRVEGIGEIRAARYGKAFLEEIARWREEGGA